MTNKSVEELISNNLYEEAFNEASSYAIGIGRKFHIRGMDRKDIDNETLYSLWTAIISFDSEQFSLRQEYLLQGPGVADNIIHQGQIQTYQW